jgi:hypothetical protein
MECNGLLLSPNASDPMTSRKVASLAPVFTFGLNETRTWIGVPVIAVMERVKRRVRLLTDWGGLAEVSGC